MHDLFSISLSDAKLICGTDEAGRGPLAGEVYAAAVILDVAQPIAGLNDSKKLSAKKREQLFDEIQQKSIAWSIATASVGEIDELNILQASMLAMTRAVQGLSLKPDWVWVDGNHFPKGLLTLGYTGQALVQGDALEACISAASILAKVARDASLMQLHEAYPHYGFAQHKGYPTAQHLQALKTYGVTPHHRTSFAPVRDIIAASAS
ncbi:ribonuclease HII [Formosimonas limnophila]|uniref:Ribonuclease HII n=1 Tax=Formosimonas limnophila TaxID=1384487 RepID=A0A8J3CLK9_9BURK|nr:ribonuclease HII [Formosimonas limnophila]GHA64239.1 ribonuclease HII [Formosimonas limnophila]